MAQEDSQLELPKDEDYDVAWSTELSSKAFAEKVAEVIFKKGYCYIQMESELEPEEDNRREMMEAARARTDWTLPKPEFETAFLGYGSKSKVAWLDDGLKPSGDASEPDPVLHYTRSVGTLSLIMLPTVRDMLGFKPGTHLSGTMLRMPLGGAWEDNQLEQELLTEEEVQKGWVENHLDFIQRRKLCMMYMIENNGGSIELYPRPDLNEAPITLPVSKGKLLVFRNDMMTYAYNAKGYHDLILQSWFLEEAQQLSLGGIEGGIDEYEAIFGGPPQPSQDQVHILSAHGRLPGCGYGLEKIFSVVCMQTDCFRAIPIQRWDMDAYYASESGQFATAGKSVQKHSGLLMEQELVYFDNSFFNMSKECAAATAPTQRMVLEIGYELLQKGGYTKKTLVNEQLYTYIADVGLDWDPFKPFEDGNYAGYLQSGTTGHSVHSAARLCYALGIRGPVNQVDTACSASLVSANMLHHALSNRRFESGGPHGGISMGHQNILTPWAFIGLSGAGMIGRSGRTRTFDITANGFARGEGCGGIYVRTGTEIELAQNKLANYLSSYINQDGRSASLTAPNGPSQQACIRASMRQGGIEPDQICQTENHGTGTALGDPIETGSIARVFAKHPTALPIMSVKTMMGHLECNAGSVSLIKLIVSLINSVFCSNNHLRELNAHMVEEGFPGFYPNCLGDIPLEEGCAGLNAFGFGGTNARAEIWAPGRRKVTPREIVTRGLNGIRVDKLGPKSLLPRELQKLDCVTVACTRCLGETCWLCGMALPPSGRSGKHYCRTIRDEFANYEYCSDCYEGGYQAECGTATDFEESNLALGHGHRVYMVGSWDGFKSFEPLEEGQGGCYTGRVVLGDTASERFRLVVEKDASKAIFPVVDGAGLGARVLGPQRDQNKRGWLIDGRRDKVLSGTVYEVSLEWGDSKMHVHWKALDERMPMAEVRSQYPHTYSIARRSTGWRLEDMTCRPEDPDVWEWGGTLEGGKVLEEFHFVRDKDLKQRIYPPWAKAEEDVPVVGPDAGGKELGWLAGGRKGDAAIVELRVADGDIEVKLATRIPGEPPVCRIWHSLRGRARDIYSVVGPWADSLHSFRWMTPDEEDPDVHRLQFSIGRTGAEEFHVLVNGCRSQALYPSCVNGAPGGSMLCGPSENVENVHWGVAGPPGSMMEIILNLAAEDRCAMLTCRPLVVGAETEAIEEGAAPPQVEGGES